jgi:hypothetical protein
MSHVDVNDDNRFMSPHVGGNMDSNIDNDFEYIKKQKKMIDDRKNLIHTHVDTDSDTENIRVMNYDSNGPATKEIKVRKNKPNLKKTSDDSNSKKKHGVKYDIYRDYQYKKGVYKGNYVTEYNTHVININSDSRNKDPIIKIDKELRLSENSLKFEDNKLIIDVGKDHDLHIGDKINIVGLKYVKKSIRTYTTYIVDNMDGTTSEIRNYAVDIVRSIDDNNNSPIFMRFDVDVNIDVDKINLLPSTGLDEGRVFFFDDASNNLRYKEYDIFYDDLYVDISGFRPVDGGTHIGNIPVNSLNGRHRVYFAPRTISKNLTPDRLGIKILGLTDPILNHNNISDQKSFYIKLHTPYGGDLSDIGTFNINITFGFYGGMPVSKINAEYPVNIDHIQGYHEIKKVYNTKIEINMDRNAYFTGKFGGVGMYLSRIKEITPGFFYPNKYSIDLPYNFNNIIQARLLSTEFPNCYKVFKDATSNGKSNNKLYWQNLDDGTYIYSIELPAGNYPVAELQSHLEKLFYDVLKVNKPLDSDNVFTKNNIIRVSIDVNTNIVQFRSFKESVINYPIIKIEPGIPLTGSAYTGTRTITINHKNHGMNIGEHILISGMITTLGIPSEKLNGEFEITYIVSDSVYTIQVNSINLENTRINTSGGNGVKIYTPNIFRMIFSYDDTMGRQLGFRDPGVKSSITPYSAIVSNNKAYENDINLDRSGNKIYLKRNSLQLSGENYILMVCEELNSLINTGVVKSAFGKINMSSSDKLRSANCNESIVYNTFVPIINYYNKPIKELSKLTLSFYSSDGELFDFDGLEHSFAIELVTLNETPDETEISAGTGKLF